MHRSHRVAGALVGSAVGDALGAPFAGGPPGPFTVRFPVPARGSRTEMCGGGSLGRAPGEFTDRTQLALLVASSLLERDGLDEADLVDRLRTSRAADHGSLLPNTSAAIWFSRYGRGTSMDAA